MKVLLSIKPNFANKIFDGSKKFEFRKKIFKRNDIKEVIVYASSPVKMVIGEFEIEKILFYDKKSLWNETKDCSGIDESYFYSYFSDKESGYAIKIKKYRKYKKPLSLQGHFGMTPPQSYAYINQREQLCGLSKYVLGMFKKLTNNIQASL